MATQYQQRWLAAVANSGEAEPPHKQERPCCGARTRAGHPCKRRYLGRGGKCPNHGGLSTGPRTEAGRQAISEAQRARWAAWRQAHPRVELEKPAKQPPAEPSQVDLEELIAAITRPAEQPRLAPITPPASEVPQFASEGLRDSLRGDRQRPSFSNVGYSRLKRR